MSLENPVQFVTMNDGADFWYYKIGVNVIPCYSKNKNKNAPFSPLVSYTEWFTKELDENTFNKWKNEKLFDNGIAIIGGLVYRGLYKGQYLTMVDLDNQLAINEFCNHGLAEAARHTLIEQHKDAPDRAHVYFYTTRPTKKKTLSTLQRNETDKPKIEVKGEGGHGVHIVTPSIHKDGYPYQIISSVTMPYSTSEDLEGKINKVCAKHGIPYLTNGDSDLVRVSDMVKPEFAIYAGENRHLAVMRYMSSKRINNPEFNDDMIMILAKQFNKEHCSPPLDDNDPVWIHEFTNSKKFSEPIIQKNQVDLANKVFTNFDFAQVAAEIKEKNHFLTLKENDSMYMFTGRVYEPNAEQDIRQMCQEMIHKCKKSTTLEVIDWIRRDKTYIKMEQLFNNYIINTESGILDKDTLELKPHGPEYYTTATLPFKINPAAKNYKLWNHILTIIDAKDSFLILELLWMLISWHNPYKKMFVFKGPSNSQKTALVTIIERIIGENNLSRQRPETFLARDARFASSKFIGKRGNIASEIGNLTKEHLENQKSFVGAEKQNTEKKNDNAEYIFDPEHFTFIYSTNTLNAIYASLEDNSVIGRYQFIMFNNVIPAEKQDGEWFNKMFENEQDRETAISTIINIMLDYKRAQMRGKAKKTRFANVAETKKILRDLKPKVDRFFEDENFLVYDEGSRIDISEVTYRYEEYTGIKLKNGNLDMGYVLRSHGYQTKHSNSKTWVLKTAFGKPMTEEITKYAK